MNLIWEVQDLNQLRLVQNKDIIVIFHSQKDLLSLLRLKVEIPMTVTTILI